MEVIHEDSWIKISLKSIRSIIYCNYPAIIFLVIVSGNLNTSNNLMSLLTSPIYETNDERGNSNFSSSWNFYG